MSAINPPPTTQTTYAILAGPDCLARRRKVAQIVEVYQPVLRKAAISLLSSFPATFSEDDFTGDEILKMLDYSEDYFQTFDPQKGRIRDWLKRRIRNQVYTVLRKYKRERDHMTDIQQAEQEASMKRDVDQAIDVVEYQQIFAMAMRKTQEHFQGQQNNAFEIFMAVRSRSKHLPQSERQARWSKWDERKAVQAVWSYIENAALPASAADISDNPEDTLDICRSTWNRLKNRKTIDLPHE